MLLFRHQTFVEGKARTLILSFAKSAVVYTQVLGTNESYPLGTRGSRRITLDPVKVPIKYFWCAVSPSSEATYSRFLLQWHYPDVVSIAPATKGQGGTEFVLTVRKGKKIDSLKFSSDHRTDILTECLVCKIVSGHLRGGHSEHRS